MERLDAVVIGAGVVGLAVARELAMAGREVVILDAEDAIGTHTSSRNSEVIHAGIYYPKGSLKARACVEGKHLLYEYCASHGVPHRRCGKLIVATDQAQLEELGSIKAKAHANGVGDVDWIAKEEVARLEPELFCVGALHSPSTGIIDSHALMLAYLGDAEAHGAMLALKSPFERAVAGNGFEVHVAGSDPIACNVLINSAGLRAPSVARAIHGYRPELAPAEFYAKGNYYALGGRAPFTHLIYPAPADAHLGTHLTLDLGGQAKFGPDIEWLDVATPEAIDYRVDPARAEGFYAEVRRYWPGLPDGALAPSYSGVRPKIHGPHEKAPDFRIDGPALHGVPGLVNLFGIESPGLTSALAIAEEVLEML